MTSFQRPQESAPARLAPPPPPPPPRPSLSGFADEEEEGRSNPHDNNVSCQPFQHNQTTKREGMGSSSANARVLRVPSREVERVERGTSMALDPSCTQCSRCSSLAGSNQMRKENEEQRLFTMDEVKEMLVDYRHAYNKKVADLSRREMAVAAMERELREKAEEITAREMRLRNLMEGSTLLGVGGARPSSSYSTTDPKSHTYPSV